MSIYHSYCVHCGAIVALFSNTDRKNFIAEQEKLKGRKKGRKVSKAS